MQHICRFSQLLRSVFLLNLIFFSFIPEFSRGASNHEEEAAALYLPQTLGEDIRIQFNEQTPLYQRVMELLKTATDTTETTSSSKEQVVETLKEKLKELGRIAPQIRSEDKALFDRVTESAGKAIEANSLPSVLLEAGQLKKSFEELFPLDKSVFSKASNKPLFRGYSPTAHARATVERIKSWEEKLKQESDPAKKLILTYTLHGELATLAELRPQVISEQNKFRKTPAQERNWQDLKEQIERRFQDFTNLSKEQNAVPSFKLTNRDDFQYLLNYDRLLQKIINNNPDTQSERRDRALSLRRAILAAFEQQFKYLKKTNQLDADPYREFKEPMEKLAKESETIAANIMKTNSTIDFAENAKKGLNKNQESLTGQIKAALEKVNNQASAISNKIASASTVIGPSLFQSYQDSLKQLKEQEVSLKTLLNQNKTNEPEKVTASPKEAKNPEATEPSSKKESQASEKETVPSVANISDRVLETQQSRTVPSDDRGVSGEVSQPNGLEQSKVTSAANRGNRFGNQNPLISRHSGKASDKFSAPFSEARSEITDRGSNGVQSVVPGNAAIPRWTVGTPDLIPNGIQKVAAQTAGPESSKEALGLGGQAEDGASWYDAGGYSLRKKEQAIRAGNAKRTDGVLVGSSISQIFSTNYPTLASSQPGSLPATPNKQVNYTLNQDGTFSPKSEKEGSVAAANARSEAETESTLQKISDSNKMMDGISLENNDSEQPKTQENTLWAKLGLQPTLDSVSQFLAGFLPSSDLNSTNITELLLAKGGKLRSKRFNRELSTVDPKKAEQIKSLIIANANANPKDQLSLWERLLAWFRS